MSMRVRSVLAALAVLALPALAGAEPALAAVPYGAVPYGDEPTFPAPASLVRGDALDAWCRGRTTAINIAICGDPALRSLAIDRLRAFDEASARLTPDERKVLIADQNGWAMSYPQRCALPASAPPALPLAADMRDCLEKAGRERLAYLRSYTPAAASGTPAPGGATPPPAASPPVASPTVASPPVATAPAATAAPPASPAAAVALGPAELKPAAATHRSAQLWGFNLVTAAALGAIVVVIVGLWLWGVVERLWGRRTASPAGDRARRSDVSRAR